MFATDVYDCYQCVIWDELKKMLSLKNVLDNVQQDLNDCTQRFSVGTRPGDIFLALSCGKPVCCLAQAVLAQAMVDVNVIAVCCHKP